jgi:hypothetical protein
MFPMMNSKNKGCLFGTAFVDFDIIYSGIDRINRIWTIRSRDKSGNLPDRLHCVMHILRKQLQRLRFRRECIFLVRGQHRLSSC